MSQSQKSLQSNGRRRTLVRRRPESSAEGLFGREPFTSGREPRYYGTGVPFYQSGPGFTGGYYGYGDEAPEIPTELEREYEYDLYADRTDWQASPPPARLPQAINPQAIKWMSGGSASARSGAKNARRYPPGPKSYQRSDERIREEICDELMRKDHIDCSEVTVQVAGAKVTLDGTVPQRWMKHAIEDLAAACPGVQDVDDRIRIEATEQSA